VIILIVNLRQLYSMILFVSDIIEKLCLGYDGVYIALNRFWSTNFP
jgi:hypothetical protein